MPATSANRIPGDWQKDDRSHNETRIHLELLFKSSTHQIRVKFDRPRRFRAQAASGDGRGDIRGDRARGGNRCGQGCRRRRTVARAAENGFGIQVAPRHLAAPPGEEIRLAPALHHLRLDVEPERPTEAGYRIDDPRHHRDRSPDRAQRTGRSFDLVPPANCLRWVRRRSPCRNHRARCGCRHHANASEPRPTCPPPLPRNTALVTSTAR